jgi:Holliday junction resolvasome RuvABC endonuclease subunit
VLAAGRGKAKKPDVVAAVREMFPAANVPDHNVADGVALAGAGAFALGVRVPYSAKQVSAHAKVAWPVGERVLAGMKG